MKRLCVLAATLAMTGPALASPLDDTIPFPMEEGLQCSAQILFAANSTKGGTPFDLPDRESEALFGYGIGTGVLSYRAKLAKKYVDKQVAARQPKIKAMDPGQRRTATETCVMKFGEYKKVAEAAKAK